MSTKRITLFCPFFIPVFMRFDPEGGRCSCLPTHWVIQPNKERDTEAHGLPRDASLFQRQIRCFSLFSRHRSHRFNTDELNILPENLTLLLCWSKLGPSAAVAAEFSNGRSRNFSCSILI